MPRKIFNHRNREFRVNMYNHYNDSPLKGAGYELEEFLYQFPMNYVPEGSIVDVTLSDEYGTWNTWRICVTAPDTPATITFYPQDGTVMYIADAFGMPTHRPEQNRRLAEPATTERHRTTKEACRLLIRALDYTIDPFNGI